MRCQGSEASWPQDHHQKGIGNNIMKRFRCTECNEVFTEEELDWALGNNDHYCFAKMIGGVEEIDELGDPVNG